MNVYPHKALEAERHAANVTDKGEVGAYYWSVEVPGIEAVMRVRGVDRQVQSDAEFAEHFYPAERLDALLAAVGALDATITTTTDAAVAKTVTDVVAAFRAFREQATA